MGRAIQVLAILLIIIGVILCYYNYKNYCDVYEDYKGYIRYATINGGSHYSDLESAGNRAYEAKEQKIYWLAGMLASVIAGLPMFMFGWLFSKVEYIQKRVNENYELLYAIERLLRKKTEE